MERCSPARDGGEVYVWFVELAASAAALESCFGWLTGEERERVARFRLEHQKTAFTVSRGMLRALAGRYLAIEPGRVSFTYGPQGKPALGIPESPLRFNTAHSGRFAAYAFTEHCEVGVDIEEIRPVAEMEAIVRRYFSRDECKEWLALDSRQRESAFFRGWTRREACIKALGGGFSIPLASIRFGAMEGASAWWVHEPAEAMSGWRVYTLAPVEGYVAALAAGEGHAGLWVMPALTADAVLAWVGSGDEFPAAVVKLV
jgi:4'-phosphopantetheinyl transferase